MSPTQYFFRISPVWLIVCGLGLAFGPVFTWWVARMTDGSDDPLGFAALVAAGYFLWQRRAEIGVSRYGLWLALGIILIQAVLPLPPMIRGGCMVAALSLSLALPRRHADVMVLLFLSLPVVASMQYFGGYPLRLAAAEISRSLLWLLGISTERVGTLLRWKEHEVGVDAACSGVRMLWTTCFMAGVMAARERLTWRRTGLLLAAGLALVLVLNGLRATILFFPEARLVVWPEWTHEGIGVGLFVMVAASLVALANRLSRGIPRRLPVQPVSVGKPAIFIWTLGVILSAGVISVHRVEATPLPKSDQVSWPALFEGERLTPVPLSEAETRFATTFPGQLNVFKTGGGRTLIFRRILKASRELHSSADCLQAAGYAIHPEPIFKDDTGRGWGHYTTSGPGPISKLREVIIDQAGEAFPDPSSWFWPALLGQSRGPWTAITVME